MNYLDIAVVLIIFVFGIIALRKGFINACFGFVPMAAAIAAAYFVSPNISKFIRGTEIYAKYKEKISGYLNLEELISNSVNQSQTDIINSMNVPDFLKSSLAENNNSVVYNILNVTDIQDYISGYIANISINIITVVGFFLVTLIVCSVILKALNFVGELPVLGLLNSSTGFALGIVQGAIVVWLICILLTFFYYDPKYAAFFQLLNSSKIASVFYNNNMLLFLILKIFT